MKNGFRDLRVWQKSMDLVVAIYNVTSEFPSCEKFGLSSQIRRAIVSVPSNIAEGHTREHLKEYLHHLSMAQASLAEVETQLEIAARLEYLSEPQLRSLLDTLHALGRQIHALRRSLTQKLQS